MRHKNERPRGRAEGAADGRVTTREPSSPTPAEQGPPWITELVAELPAILTLGEMCAVLRCSRRSGYRLADSGRIHALRATDAGSSRLLIPRDALARYLRTLAGAP